MMRLLARLTPLALLALLACESAGDPDESSGGAPAPSPTLRWQTMLHARGARLWVGADGSVYVVGWSGFQGMDFDREVFSKLDPWGNLEWTRERTFGLAAIADDGFLVPGEDSIRKLDVDGAPVWTVATEDRNIGVLQSLSGGGLVAGGGNRATKLAWAMRLDDGSSGAGTAA